MNVIPDWSLVVSLLLLYTYQWSAELGQLVDWPVESLRDELGI